MAAGAPPPIPLRWHTQAAMPALAAALADAVAAALRNALASRDRATLALSGGTTPGPFLDALATRTLDWARVIVTLDLRRYGAPLRRPGGGARRRGRLVASA